MPISYTINKEIGVITLTVSGELFPSDVTDYLQASRNDPLFRPNLHRLVVLTDVEAFPTSVEVREVTSRTQGAPPDPSVRIAAVAETPLAHGMVAMFFGLWGLTDRYRMFNAVTPAMAWIVTGVEPS